MAAVSMGSMGNVPGGLPGPPPGPPPPPPPAAGGSRRGLQRSRTNELLATEIAGPRPGCWDCFCSWLGNFQNPMGYSQAMKQRGFENFAFISPKRARYVGRRIMITLYLAIPLLAAGLGFGLHRVLSTPVLMATTIVPIVVIWVIGCYCFSYCVFGRVLRFERPSRQYGYTWPYTFECGFMAMILLFLLFGWFGLLFPCTSEDMSAGIVVAYSALLVITIANIVYIVVTDPSDGSDLSASPVEGASAKHQWCIFCSARAKIDRFEGPWTVLEAKLGRRVTDCYYPHTRRRHCQSCQKCVNGFDHHCYYLNTCICDNNYKQFVLMLTSLFGMVAIQFVFGALVLTNHFDNNQEAGRFGGILNNQNNVMNDVYGTQLFVTLVCIMVAVCVYALWFLGDLLAHHYYFIWRTVRSEKGTPRYTTLDYLHEQRLDKLKKAVQRARTQLAHDPAALAAAIHDEQDHYAYNRANYLYHDDIDMTGKEELNIQHGHQAEHVEHLEDESQGLHCWRAVGCEALCYKLERWHQKCAGMDTGKDETTYYENNYLEGASRRDTQNTQGDETARSSEQDQPMTIAELIHNEAMVDQMYQLRASAINPYELNSPPQSVCPTQARTELIGSRYSEGRSPSFELHIDDAEAVTMTTFARETNPTRDSTRTTMEGIVGEKVC